MHLTGLTHDGDVFLSAIKLISRCMFIYAVQNELN